MQNQRQSIINRSTKIISQSLHHLFEPIEFAPIPDLLNPQPAFQRKMFIQKALSDHLLVYLQLMPKTAAGQPVEVRGYLKSLGQDRYLVQSKNLSYFFDFDQLRYIAHPLSSDLPNVAGLFLCRYGMIYDIYLIIEHLAQINYRV